MAGSQASAWPSGDSTLRWIALFAGLAFLAGLGMLGGAAYLAIDTRHAIATATRADGTVIDLIVSHDSDSDTYHPRVRFVTANGESVEFTGTVGSSPAAFDIGERVTVLYDPAQPQEARIDAFFQLWFMPLVLAILGSVFTLAGGGVTIALLRLARKPSRPTAIPQPSGPAAARPTSAVERRPRD